MKTLIYSILTTLLFVSCGGGSHKKSAEQQDASTVYVYYFHGKQRCKTCISVENVTKQTIENVYSGNDKVKYIEVKTDKAENNSLIEKYEVTWNALIIAKGNEFIDITKNAFATAVNSPDVLTEQIKTEINKLLE